MQESISKTFRLMYDYKEKNELLLSISYTR